MIFIFVISNKYFDMNKHLIKIINDYLDYKKPFYIELLDKTKELIIPNSDNWYYYDHYAICSESYSLIYNEEFIIHKKGYIFSSVYNGRFEIKRTEDHWEIK